MVKRVLLGLLLIVAAGLWLVGLICSRPADCPAAQGPRSQQEYRQALADAQRRYLAQAEHLFTRTGRMDRQDIRYDAIANPIMSEQDISDQAHFVIVTQR